MRNSIILLVFAIFFATSQGAVFRIKTFINLDCTNQNTEILVDDGFCFVNQAYSAVIQFDEAAGQYKYW